MSDIAFARMMIPHHEQAVEMADLALAREDISEDLRSLATAIKAAQQPEIEQMQGWLDDWRAPRMPGGHSDHGGMAGMGGMASAADLRRLGDTTGTAFERLWMELMIEHHEGAIDMAESALAATSDDRVRSLTRSIISSQQEEIDLMRQRLSALP